MKSFICAEKTDKYKYVFWIIKITLDQADDIDIKLHISL